MRDLVGRLATVRRRGEERKKKGREKGEESGLVYTNPALALGADLLGTISHYFSQSHFLCPFGGHGQSHHAFVPPDEGHPIRSMAAQRSS